LGAKDLKADLLQKSMENKSRIIAALDFDQRSAAENFLEKIKSELKVVKIGPVLFMKEGAQFVNQLSKEGFEIFLDMKFHDIPNTVSGALKAACESMKLKFVTLHASGGEEMIRGAKETVTQVSPDTKILSVTILTSLVADAAQIETLANIAVAGGSDGLVCSPHEIQMIRKKVSKDALLVVPGIRSPVERGKDDQKRIATAKEAFEWGADYLVIGRPLTKASDPKAALEEMLS